MIYSVVRFLLVFVEITTAILLIGVILIQRTKSQGMGLAFGVGMGESLFGAHVGNVLTRATVVLGVIFLLNTTVLALMQSGHRGAVSVTETATVPPAPMPPPSSGLPTPGPAPELPPMDLSGSVPEGQPSTEAPAPPIEIPAAGAVDVPTVDVPAVDVPVVDVPAPAADVPVAEPVAEAPKPTPAPTPEE